MTPRAFDAIARHAAHALNRRAFLGVAFGAAFTIVKQPLPTFGKKDPHDGGGGGNNGGGGGHKGGKDKKDKKDKNCQKLAGTCLFQVEAYCRGRYLFDQQSYTICLSLYSECCRIYKKCDILEGDRCIRDVNAIILD